MGGFQILIVTTELLSPVVFAQKGNFLYSDVNINFIPISVWVNG